MKNCYIVAARPDNSRKYKLLLENLRILRKHTKCPIIVTVNYFPLGIENWKNELYDYITYTDLNEIEKNENAYQYHFTTDEWDWYTEEHDNEFGRAVNNLYLRGAQVAKSLGIDNFIFINYDVTIHDKKTTSFLESCKKNIFFTPPGNSTTGELFFQTWMFKLNNNSLNILEDLSTVEGYNKVKYDKSYAKIGFYELIVYRAINKKYRTKGLDHYCKIINIEDFEKYNLNMDCDNFFPDEGFRVVKDPKHGQVVILVEFMHSSIDRIVSLEFEGNVVTFGNVRENWHTMLLGKFREGMYYKAKINDREYHITITEEYLNKNQLIYKN